MSDWGRPSNASNPPRRRGPGIFAMLIILVLGVGLGAFGILYLERTNLLQQSGDTLSEVTSELNAQIAENTELKRQLAAQQDSGGQALDLQGVLEEQEKIVAELRAENQTLKDQLETSTTAPANSNSTEAVDQLTEKVGQLEASLALAGQVNAEMEARLKDSDNIADELQARLELAEQLTNDLQSRLDAAQNEQSSEPPSEPGNNAAVSALEQQLKQAEQINTELEDRLNLAEQVTSQLQTELTAARQAVDEAGRQAETGRDASANIENNLKQAESALKQAEDQLSLAERQKAEADERLKLAEQVNNALQAQLDNAVKTDIPSLESDLAERNEQLEVLDKEITRLNTQLDQLADTKAVDSARITETRENADAEIASLSEELESIRKLAEKMDAENATLRGQVSRLETTNKELLSSLETATQPAVSPQKDSGNTANPQMPRTPRDPLLVATAMKGAPGLQDLDNDQRDRIATRLIEGDCVGETLQDELGRVSPITLRDLIRAFESDC